MFLRRLTRCAGSPLAAVVILGCSASTPAGAAPVASPPAPLAIGETFTLESRVLGERRRINVYRPEVYGESTATARPVLYMPDGGLGEDFLHVAGLLQISVSNGTMRPFLLVGIENTERRRDLTGPTSNPEDRKVAPRVGGSPAFRRFLRDELVPAIEARYATTKERAIIGESFAGLFVVETLFEEPDLFDSYVAIDPSLWWNDSALVAREPPAALRDAGHPRTLFLANGDEPTLARHAALLTDRLRRARLAGLVVEHVPLPAETHATIYHPAALIAVRKLFAPSVAGR